MSFRVCKPKYLRDKAEAALNFSAITFIVYAKLGRFWHYQYDRAFLSPDNQELLIRFELW